MNMEAGYKLLNQSFKAKTCPFRLASQLRLGNYSGHSEAKNCRLLQKGLWPVCVLTQTHCNVEEWPEETTVVSV